jgi:hypothetical protein
MRFHDSTCVFLKNGAAPGSDGSGVSRKPRDKAHVADQWSFLAMTWKRSENTANDYMGTATNPPTSSRKISRSDTVDAAKENKSLIGNDPVKTDRAFNGFIDNVRFYTKSLDAAALTRIYSADLKNETASIPRGNAGVGIARF